MVIRRLDKPTFGGFAVRHVPERRDIGQGVVQDGMSLAVERDGRAATPEVKRERARLFLEALRGPAGGERLSFGGRVAGGFDAPSSLRAYYPSLAIAKEMFGAVPPEGRGGVLDYLDAVSVPNDLRPLLRRAAELSAVRAVELGDVAIWENAADYRNLYQQWKAGNLDVTRINDATVDKLFGAWAFPPNVEGYLNRGTPEFKVGLVRMFARAKERGGNINPNIAQVAANLPATDEAAAALARLCEAMGFPPQNVVLGGRRLDQWDVGVAVRPAAAPAVRRVPGRPLGKVKTWQNDANYNQWWQAFTQGQPDATQIDDATLDKLFGAWGMNNNIQNYRQYGDVAHKIRVVEMFARAKERGLNVAAHPNHVNTYFSKAFPADARSIAVMHRFARAFGLAPNQLIVANQNLQQLPDPGPQGGAPFQLPEPKSCGNRSGDLAALRKMVTDKSNALMSLNDDALKALPQAAQLTVLGQMSGEFDWHRDLIAVAARSVFIGARNANEFLQYARTIPMPALEHPDVSAALALATKQVGLQPNQVVLANGQRLDTAVETTQAQRDLDRVLAGVEARVPQRRSLAAAAEPLGVVETNNYGELYNVKDENFFALSDSSINAQIANANIGVANVLNHYANDPRSYAVFARVVELQPNSTTANQARAFLDQPIAEQYVAPGAVPHLVRLAAAFGRTPDQVTVQHEGQNIPLDSHPAYRELSNAGSAQRSAALLQDLQELDPAADHHGAVREGAVLRLLFAEPDAHVHELSELLPRLIDARGAGRLQPIDLMNVPGDYAEKFLGDALESWPHLGAAAVLIGLTANAPIATVRKVLGKHGYFPEQLEEYAQLATTLARMNDADAAYVTRDIARDPNELDFGSVALRTQIAKSRGAAKELDPIFETSDVTTALRAVLDRAGLAEANSKERKDLLAYVEKLVGDGVVERSDVHEALDLRTAIALDPDRVAQLDELVARVADTEGAERKQALERLAADVADGTAYLSSSALTTRALLSLYERDLEHVAPLEEADAQLGGVQGKAWNLRQRDAVAHATVEGVDLPVDERPDRDLGAVPKEGMPPHLDTSTGRKNLRLLAARWRVAGPIVLSGQGASEMKDAVRGLAAVTSSPLRRIALDDVRPEELFAPNGPIVRAAEAGEVVHLVATKTLEPAMVAALDGGFDSSGNVRLPPPARAVKSDGRFRVVVSLADRAPNQPSELTSNALSTLNLRALPKDELAKWLNRAAPGLADGVADQLATVYDSLRSQRAAGSYGAPMPALGLDKLVFTARRIAADPEHARRHIDEVLLGAIAPDFRQNAVNVVQGQFPEVAPAQDAPPPAVTVSRGTASVDGQEIARDPEAGALKKSDVDALALTQDRIELLRSVATALESGETVALIGPELPGIASLEDAYAVLSGRPYGRFVATPSSSVEDLVEGDRFKPELRGAIVAVHGIDEAPEAYKDTLVRLANASREDGGDDVRLVFRMNAAPEGNPALPSGATVVRAEPAGDDQRDVVRASAYRMGLPESVADAMYDLHERVVQSYANNTLGRNLGANAKPTYDLAALFGALRLASELMSDGDPSAAYLTAVETFYSAADPNDTDRVLEMAREVAQ